VVLLSQTAALRRRLNLAAAVPITEFFAAGTGKSLLLRHIVRALPPASTFATASTGLAAAALGGTTLNAFAGVGRGDGGRDAMLRAASRPDAAGRWRRASVLVVDEVCRQHLGAWCSRSLRTIFVAWYSNQGYSDWV